MSASPHEKVSAEAEAEAGAAVATARMVPVRMDFRAAIVASVSFAVAASTRMAISGSETSSENVIAIFLGAFVGAGVGYAMNGRRRSITNPEPWPLGSVAISAASAARRAVLSTAIAVGAVVAYVTLMPSGAMPGVTAISFALIGFGVVDLRTVRLRERRTGSQLYRPMRRRSTLLSNPYKTVYEKVR